MVICFAGSTLCVLISVVFARPIGTLFGAEGEVLDFTVKYMPQYAWAFIIAGFNTLVSAYLYSTKRSVHAINIEDIDFSERECVVYGKGDKERKAYFDAKTKIHLLNYIESRTDNNIAVFVSLNQPHSRLTESGVELRLREMGKKSGVEKVHPHKFRRTMATRAIEKGMPIEQVQKILGHEQIDTTLRYAYGKPK